MSFTRVQFTPFYFKTPIFGSVFFLFGRKVSFSKITLSFNSRGGMTYMRPCPRVPASHSSPEFVCASSDLSLSLARARSLALPFSLSHSAPEVLCASLHVRPCQGECVCVRACVSHPHSQAYQSLICIASLGLFINHANSLLAPLLTLPFLGSLAPS